MNKYRRIPREYLQRGAALSYAITLQGALEEALKITMRKDNEVAGLMFRDIGPLGSFGTQIRLGYLLSLYEKDIYDDLITISKIRNAFAHKPEVSDFDSPKVFTLCNKLQVALAFDEDALHPVTIADGFDRDIVDIIRSINFGGSAASVLFARSCVVLTALMALIIDSVKKTENKVVKTDVPIVASKYIKQSGTRPRRRSRS